MTLDKAEEVRQLCVCGSVLTKGVEYACCVEESTVSLLKQNNLGLLYKPGTNKG